MSHYSMRPLTVVAILSGLVAVLSLALPVPGEYLPSPTTGVVLDSFPDCWRIVEGDVDGLSASGPVVHLLREPLIPGRSSGWYATGHEYELGGWRPAAGDSFDLAAYYHGARLRFALTADTTWGMVYWSSYPNLFDAMLSQGGRIRGVAVPCPESRKATRRSFRG